jgi:hypothetical protein
MRSWVRYVKTPQGSNPLSTVIHHVHRISGDQATRSLYTFPSTFELAKLVETYRRLDHQVGRRRYLRFGV